MGNFIREMYEKSHKRDVWGISLNRKTRILTKIIEFSILTLFVCLFVCLSLTSLSWILSDFSQISNSV